MFVGLNNFVELLNRWLVKTKLLILLMVAILALGGCQVVPSRSDAASVTKITLWQGVNPPPNRDVLQVLVDKFNREHPDIQVESYCLFP